MRVGWGLVALVLVACGLREAGVDHERTLADLQESAVAAFVTARAERGLPAGPLEYRAGEIYGAAPQEESGGLVLWQVRRPRADAVQLPLHAQDRRAGIELKADVLVRYEDRHCRLPGASDEVLRCEPWQEASCCNQIWKRSRGGWVAERPR